jgi:hypothetical protein
VSDEATTPLDAEGTETETGDDAALARDEAIQAVIDQGRDDRLWMRAAAPLLTELRLMLEGDPPPQIPARVRFGLDRAYIAICERIGRISRRDLPGE